MITITHKNTPMVKSTRKERTVRKIHGAQKMASCHDKLCHIWPFT